MAKKLTQETINTVDLLVNYAIESQPNPCDMLPMPDLDNLPKGLSGLRDYGMELHLIGIIDEWAEFKRAAQQ